MGDSIKLQLSQKEIRYLEDKLLNKLRQERRIRYKISGVGNKSTLIIEGLGASSQRFVLNIGIDIANTLKPWKRVNYEARIRRFKRIIEHCEERLKDISAEKQDIMKDYTGEHFMDKTETEVSLKRLYELSRMKHNADCKLYNTRNYKDRLEEKLKLLNG